MRGKTGKRKKRLKHFFRQRNLTHSKIGVKEILAANPLASCSLSYVRVIEIATQIIAERINKTTRRVIQDVTTSFNKYYL